MSEDSARTLVLVRHGQSTWNELDLFTGLEDVALTPLGVDEAVKAGRELRRHRFRFDAAYTSKLQRAQETLRLILSELGQDSIPIESAEALNERDYGDLTGLNKTDAIKRWGKDKVHQWRRSYDLTPPGGESLKDTAARVIPYFKARILPDLLAGKNLLIAAHGNSLRSLVMHLDHMTPRGIEKLSLATGVPRVYRLDGNGDVAEMRDLVD
jgi:2,3-bisphosphoglycerate-dependent phosphoglycerate mutase